MSEKNDPAVAEARHAEVLRAMAARDFATARALLSNMAAVEPANMGHWIGIATTFRLSGQPAQAIGALDQGLKYHPRHFMALLMRASILDSLNDSMAPEAYSIALAQLEPGQTLDAPTQKAVARAREVSEAHTQNLRRHLVESLNTIEADCTPLEMRKFHQFFDDALRLRKRYHQEPAQFYYPGLPAIEFYDRSFFPWLEALEAQTDAITEELMGVIDKDFTGFVPYIDYADHMPLDQWAELNRNPNWGAFHLIEGGKVVTANAERCPRTMAAIAPLPQPHIGQRGPSAMFSALKPHTRIPPHTGISNTRLVAHLPLIIPDHCGFRVGNESRAWNRGEAFVFDDTINHEAWNDSDQVRIILIVDIWTPFLSPSEQAAIKTIMEAMDTVVPIRSGSL